MKDVINQLLTWDDMLKKYPSFDIKKEDEKVEKDK